MKNITYLLFAMALILISCKKKNDVSAKIMIDERILSTWRIESYQYENNGNWSYHEPDEYIQYDRNGTLKFLYVNHNLLDSNKIKNYTYSVENEVIKYKMNDQNNTEKIISVIDGILTTRLNEDSENFIQVKKRKVDGDIEDYMPSKN